MTPHFPFITASGIDRFLACRGSALIPRVTSPRSAYADAGVAEHAVKLQCGQLPAKVLAWFGGVDPLYEIAMAADLDGDDAIYGGQYLERDYPSLPGPRWLAGTADMLRIDGDVVSVGDLKTGRGQARGALPMPGESGQLLGLAWMAVRLRQKKDRCEECLGKKTINGGECWRCYGSGLEKGPRATLWTPSRIRLMWWLTHDVPDDINDAEITYAELCRWGDKLCEAATKQGTLVLSRGPQCGGCSAFDACPAQGGAIRRLLDLGSDNARAIEALTDDQIGDAFVNLEAAERACETARAALLRRVEDRGAVAVGATHTLKLVRGTDTKIDLAIAAEVLGDQFPACVTASISQAGLKRGLSTQDIGPTLEQIRLRGGLSTVPKAPYLRIVKRKPE